MSVKTVQEVRVSEKELLTLDEAAALFGIGVNKLRSLTDEQTCDYVLFVGSKRLIKKRQFLDFIKFEYSL